MNKSIEREQLVVDTALQTMQETGAIMSDRFVDVTSELQIERIGRYSFFNAPNQTQILHSISGTRNSFVAEFDESDMSKLHCVLRDNDLRDEDAAKSRIATSPVAARALFADFTSDLLPNTIEEDSIKWWFIGGKDFCAPQNAFMSKLGAVASAAAGLFLEPNATMNARLNIRLDGCGYRMYSTPYFLANNRQPSNWVRFQGRNRDTRDRVDFSVSAKPETKDVVASAVMKIGTRQDDRLHVVQDRLVCPSTDGLAFERSRYINTQGEKTEYKDLGMHPTSFETALLEMVHKAAQVLKSR